MGARKWGRGWEGGGGGKPPGSSGGLRVTRLPKCSLVGEGLLPRGGTTEAGALPTRRADGGAPRQRCRHQRVKPVVSAETISASGTRAGCQRCLPQLGREYNVPSLHRRERRLGEGQRHSDTQ